MANQIPEEGWHDLLLHNLKQLAIERFLGCGIERVLRGHLESITTYGVHNDENKWLIAAEKMYRWTAKQFGVTGYASTKTDAYISLFENMTAKLPTPMPTRT